MSSPTSEVFENEELDANFRPEVLRYFNRRKSLGKMTTPVIAGPAGAVAAPTPPKDSAQGSSSITQEDLLQPGHVVKGEASTFNCN